MTTTDAAVAEQRRCALRTANRVRARRAWLKRLLKGGRLPVGDALAAPEFASMRLTDFLGLLPWRVRTNQIPRRVTRYDSATARRMARQCQVLPTRRVGDLTGRERAALVAWWAARERRLRDERKEAA